MRDIVTDKLKVGLADQVEHIGFLARKEVVDADDVVPVGDEALADVRAQEPGTAGDKNPLDL